MKKVFLDTNVLAAVFGASPRVFRAFMCNFACVKALCPVPLMQNY